MKTLLGFALSGLAAVWIGCASNASPVSPSNKAVTDDGSTTQVSTFTVATNVALTDPNLDAVVRETLGTRAPSPNDSLTTYHLELLTVLDARNKSIQSLAGLQHATKLDTLNLDNNSITDVTPLGSLTNLKALSLNFNSVTNVSPLVSLTNLTRFEAVKNKLRNLTPLASLTNLEYLNLQRNGIRDVTPLAGLINLEELHLYTNSITDVSSLTRLTKLKRFGIGGNWTATSHNLTSGLTGLIPNMPDLVWLKINGIGLTDISFLENLKKLEWLNVSANRGITDLSPLACLPELETLRIVNMPIVGNAADGYNGHIQYLIYKGVTVVS